MCTGCLVWKHPEKRYEVGNEIRDASALDLIHDDLSGPMPTTSLNGYSCFMTFIDDCSRYYWVYFLKQKFEVLETFKIFKGLDEDALENKIKALIYDNEGEYVKIEFQQLCASTGIQIQHSDPYILEHNGIDERKKKSLKEMATCLLEARNIPTYL